MIAGLPSTISAELAQWVDAHEDGRSDPELCSAFAFAATVMKSYKFFFALL